MGIKQLMVRDNTKQKNTFIPAARFHIFTPFFDFLLSLFGLGRPYRNWVFSLISSELKEEMTILDAGSGTGLLACKIKKKSNSTLIGVDIDPAILDIANKRAKRENVDITWKKASLTDLPFTDNSFDFIYSSLVMHHLTKSQKKEAFLEIHRVLNNDSSFYLFDIGDIGHSWNPIASWFTYLFEEGKENYNGEMPSMLKEAGFSKVEFLSHYRFNFICIKATKTKQR